MWNSVSARIEVCVDLQIPRIIPRIPLSDVKSADVLCNYDAMIFVCVVHRSCTELPTLQIFVAYSVNDECMTP